MLDAPEITDAEYDRMLVRLRELEAAWPDDVPAYSPTRRVGGKVNPEFTEVRHLTPFFIFSTKGIDRIVRTLAVTFSPVTPSPRVAAEGQHNKGGSHGTGTRTG